MNIHLAVLSVNPGNAREQEEMLAYQLSSLLGCPVTIRSWMAQSMADDAVYLCFDPINFTVPDNKLLITIKQHRDTVRSGLKEARHPLLLRRCIMFYGFMKAASVDEGCAGDCHYWPQYLAEGHVISGGFFGKRWEVSLMDGIADTSFSSASYSHFKTLQPQPGIEILAEYCHVIYGVEWINTLDVAPPGRAVSGQHYLTLVGIYEGARRFLQDVPASVVVLGGFDALATNVEVFPAFASPDDPRRPIAMALVREAAHALEAMWEDPPATMAPHLVARMHKRYSLEELQRAQR
jgi:hypothetical protein